MVQNSFIDACSVALAISELLRPEEACRTRAGSRTLYGLFHLSVRTTKEARDKQIALDEVEYPSHLDWDPFSPFSIDEDGNWRTSERKFWCGAQEAYERRLEQDLEEIRKWLVSTGEQERRII